MRFKPNPVMLALLAAPIIVCSPFYTHAAIIDAWTPEANDAQAGVINVTNRSETLEGNPRFTPSETGAVNTTLDQVVIAAGSDYLNQDRLNPGPQNAAVLVTGATRVPDIQNVNNKQYIDARVANIGNKPIPQSAMTVITRPLVGWAPDWIAAGAMRVCASTRLICAPTTIAAGAKMPKHG